MSSKIIIPFIAVLAVAHSHDVISGLNTGGRKIFDEKREASPAIWRQVNNVTINASDSEVISRVVVTDLRPEKDGDAKIVEGGEGQKNVTVELKSPTVLRGYEFRIEVFVVPDQHPVNENENKQTEPENPALGKDVLDGISNAGNPKTNLDGKSTKEPEYSTHKPLPVSTFIDFKSNDDTIADNAEGNEKTIDQTRNSRQTEKNSLNNEKQSSPSHILIKNAPNTSDMPDEDLKITNQSRHTRDTEDDASEETSNQDHGKFNPQATNNKPAINTALNKSKDHKTEDNLRSNPRTAPEPYVIPISTMYADSTPTPLNLSDKTQENIHILPSLDINNGPSKLGAANIVKNIEAKTNPTTETPRNNRDTQAENKTDENTAKVKPQDVLNPSSILFNFEKTNENSPTNKDSSLNQDEDNLHTDSIHDHSSATPNIGTNIQSKTTTGKPSIRDSHSENKQKDNSATKYLENTALKVSSTTEDKNLGFIRNKRETPLKTYNVHMPVASTTDSKVNSFSLSDDYNRDDKEPKTNTPTIKNGQESADKPVFGGTVTQRSYTVPIALSFNPTTENALGSRTKKSQNKREADMPDAKTKYHEEKFMHKSDRKNVTMEGVAKPVISIEN